MLLAGGGGGGGALTERGDCASAPADVVSSTAMATLRVKGRLEIESMHSSCCPDMNNGEYRNVSVRNRAKCRRTKEIRMATIVPLNSPASSVPLKSGNRLLAMLGPQDRALLAPHLEPVTFAVGDFITRAGAPIEHLCFLEQGIAGVLDSLDDDRRYAVGLLGAEGFIGWPLLMGDDRSPYDVTMRAEAGYALRIPANALLAAVAQSATLRMTLLRFAYIFMLQMGRTIVSSLAHSIERRMAR